MSTATLPAVAPTGGTPAALRAIGIMWRRQMIRFMRSRSRIVAAMAQPVLFLVTFGFGFGAIYSQAGQGSYIQFLAPGIIGMSILFTAVFSGIEVIWDRQFGFLKETLVAPVPRVAIMIGRALGGATVAVIQGCLVLLVTLLVGFRPYSVLMIPAALVMMGLVAVMATAFGTVAGAVLKDMQGFNLVMNLIIMPLFFLSGALFPLDGLPTAMAWLVAIDPITYGIDGIRALFNGAGHYSLLTDVAIVGAITVLLMLVGARLFRRIEA